MFRHAALFCSLWFLAALVPAHASETIKVGILHSLSGTMAISERSLKDSMLMLIDEQNQRGGLLGRRLEPVVIDPASNWLLYAEKARLLIKKEEVAVIFGCWTSASRKAVKPVVEELGALLFYPVQYEGQEYSPNIFYLGAAPNQQALPAVDYLMNQKGIERWILAGTDYVYPRTTNRILVSYLESNGVAKEDILLSYTGFGHSDWERIVAEYKYFAGQGKKTAIVSTINGDANIAFYRELAAQNVSARQLPVLAFSVGEQELSSMDVQPLVGHMAAWNYFMSIDTPRNKKFVSAWQAFMGSGSRVTNDPMEAHYIGFQMWVKSVEHAGSTEVNQVRKAMIDLAVPNLTGGMARMSANHHISKPVYIGEIQADGQYRVLWSSAEAVPGDPWSEYLPEKRNGGLN
jgi:urea transport system substrate-binding protein